MQGLDIIEPRAALTRLNSTDFATSRSQIPILSWRGCHPGSSLRVPLLPAVLVPDLEFDRNRRVTAVYPEGQGDRARRAFLHG